ncbi:MAG TPA: shikimate dehydrogenase [Streptosporangiaceae bacterium]|nr:shikimate dehydrogenase [Streptosporangiaceae bacterium]
MTEGQAASPDQARRAAVLGSPIAHSLSPALHRAAYRELGLEGWSYDAIECGAEGLPALLDSLGPEWAGLSLTMPLKRAVLPLLDETEPLAAEVGAANTVILAGGQRRGFNTDVSGIVTALRQAGVTSTDGNVLVIGSGATACSALAALRETGADEVTVAARSVARAEPVLAVADRVGIKAAITDLGADLPRRAWQLLISTIPAAGADIIAGRLASGLVTAAAVLDVSYDPWPTVLSEAAARTGSTVISGYEMLVWQAAAQVELMTGLQAPAGAMHAAGLAEIARRRNNG